MLHLRLSILTCWIIALACCSVAQRSATAQDAGSRYRSLPLDPAGDKRKKEKDEFLNPEKFDLAGIEAYYKENLLPRLVQENAVSMNDARSELMNDIDIIERKSRGNSKMLEDYNKMLARLMLDVISTKDQNDKLAHPSSRVIAAVVAGRLNRQAPTSQSGGLPDPEGTKILLRVFSPTENDGMVAAALTHLPRHWTWPGMDANTMELARKRFVSNAEAFLGGQKPGARGEEEDSYIQELLIDNLTIIAKSDTESAKAAKTLLMSLVKGAVEKYRLESEWLVETAIHSFGQMPKPELTDEELVDFEVNTIKFLQASLRSWNRRCAQTTSSTPRGIGGGSGGYPGGPGGGGPGGGGLGGGDDPSGAGPGGGAGGRPGPGGGAPRPRNPFDEQPKEVKVARRFLQQRLERVHYGLTGTGKSSTNTPSKGLVAFAAEERKDKLEAVVSAIEALQKALNDDKIKGLDSLASKTRVAMTELQTACEAIVGSDGQVDLPVEAESADSDSSNDPSGSDGSDLGGGEGNGDSDK